MRKYIYQGFLIFICLEIVTRILIDPLYYYLVDSYTIDKSGYNVHRLYFPEKTEQIDYLFIGSSRMPASIDINEFTRKKDSIVVVNAGKGFSTGSVHYLALTRLVENNPDILTNARVIIETEGGMNFTENFEKGRYKMDEYSLILLLPHLTLRSFIDFIRYSECELSLKIQLTKLYCSALYRNIPFIIDKAREKLYKADHEVELIAAEGGIKTDAESIEQSRQIVIGYANQRIEDEKNLSPFSEQDMNNSVMAAIHELISENGGRIILLDMPLHSVQDAVFTNEYNSQNKETFHNWTKKNNIPLVALEDFNYSDDDFPDFGHLGIHRRIEFTNKVMEKLKKIE